MPASFASRVADPGARPVVLDGGLATRLEARGNDLSSHLWSARLLLDDPAEVREAHRDFLAAGAEVITTASYQVSYDGLAAAGLGTADTDRLLRLSVATAREAVEPAVQSADDGPRWVAASVGPYGAALADGSEYRGDYGLSVDQLRAWHRRRLYTLIEAEPDVLAIETIPCRAEAEALLAEVQGSGMPCWLSLTNVADRTRLGEPLAEAFGMAAEVPEVIAVGVNCCAAAGVADTARLAVSASGKPAVVYPNSGEGWNAFARAWDGQRDLDPADAAGWVAAGARIVGGCCRVTPDDIAAIARALA
ncbi:MAG TPA: homocysteine S-methyltransferase [Dermatophilaceae bacterium]|nr:homocysteine S-methyltransferase [Dermatophilaceae bacterium]